MHHNDRPLPQVMIPIERSQCQIAPDHDVHTHIQETYTRVLGPIIPESHNVRLFVNLESTDKEICVQYMRSWADPSGLNKLIEVGAYLCNLSDYDWDASPLILVIKPYKATAHELIELRAEIQSLPPRLRDDHAYASARSV
jgi:hypothetical protein